jgi:hypothetical protein
MTPQEAPKRPVLTSRRHIADVRNNIDHFRGDKPEELTSFLRISKYGRFHAEKPRSFATPASPTASFREPRPTLRTNVQRPVDHVQRLLHGTAPSPTGPAAVPLRRSASFATSRDHPLSPSRRLGDSDVSSLALSRVASLASLKKASSFWTTSDPQPVRCKRSFNSIMSADTSRVLEPAKQDAATPSRHRSQSPTFVRSSTPDADSCYRRCLRTEIPKFVPDQPVRRPTTPTRRHPFPGGQETHVFASNAEANASVERSIARVRDSGRRASTPTPPQRGFNSLSLIDSPFVTPRPCRRPVGPSSDPQDGIFRRCGSIPRSTERNRSSIVFAW